VIYDDDSALARSVGNNARESARPAALRAGGECAAAAATNTSATWACARDVCAARGQRLCAPADVRALATVRSSNTSGGRSRRRTSLHEDEDGPKEAEEFWTSHACHSCWMKEVNKCPSHKSLGDAGWTVDRGNYVGRGRGTGRSYGMWRSGHAALSEALDGGELVARCCEDTDRHQVRCC